MTIQHAADTADPTSGTPITIHVAAGTYAEQVDVDTYAGTDDDNRIIYDGDVENDSGDGATRPIVTGATNFAINQSYITIRDFDCSGASAIGIALYKATPATHCIIERNIVRGSVYSGIRADGCTAQTSLYHVIRNNIVYGCNTVEGANRAGITVIRGASYCDIYNNVCFANNVNGISLWYVTYTQDNINIKNNISHDNTTNQIISSSANITFTSDYNDFYADSGTRVGDFEGTTCAALSDWQTASSQDTNSQEGDPLYVDEANDDFHIIDNASPCFGNGTDLSGTFTDDYDKDTRTTWDIGADYIATVVAEGGFMALHTMRYWGT